MDRLVEVMFVRGGALEFGLRTDATRGEEAEKASVPPGAPPRHRIDRPLRCRVLPFLRLA